MIKQLHKFLLLVAMVFIALGGYAEKVNIDGIYYDLDKAKKTASVTYAGEEFSSENNRNAYIGNIIIPSSISSYGNTYSVTDIGEYAFSGCSGLTSVTIPSSVTGIGEYAFYGCSGLTSVTIPSSVTYIGEYAFYGCSGLTSVTIPSSVTYIRESVFGDCTGLTSVTIPSSVTYIGESAFGGCTGLTSVTIPSFVTSIGESAFLGCTGLTSVTIPSSVTRIENSAFYGCSGLTSVTIPSSVRYIGISAFNGCSGLTSINVSSDNTTYSSVDGVLYNKNKTELLRFPNGKTGSFTIPSSVTRIEYYAFSGCSGLTSLTIPSSVTHIWGYAFSGCSGLTSLTIPSSVRSMWIYAFSGCTLRSLIFEAQLSSYLVSGIGVYNQSVFEGLDQSSVIYAYSSEVDKIRQIWSGAVIDIEEPYACAISQIYLSAISFSVVANEYVATTLQTVRFNGTEVFPDKDGLYTVTGLAPNSSYSIVVTYKTAEGEERSYTQTVNTLKPKVSMRLESATQTTMTISVNASSDETCAVGKMGFEYDGKTYDCTKGKVVLRNLAPGSSYSIIPFAYYGTKRIEGDGFRYKTVSLYPNISTLNISPTSISVKGSYTAGDAHVSETGFTDRGTGDVLTLTGLTPNTDYTVTYYVKTEEGGNETVSRTFTTSALELTTLQPRCVSGSCAVVAAETNICEEETNVGFQWKKYDAPESLKPNEGYAAIYGGQLEGYIRNLQSTSYYNVRAFYKSAEGKYYYGDWVTFDPSDFSYFEPTVHTYAAAEVTHSSARMKGYILAGTDAIEEQGFEYWPLGIGTADKVQTVLATGQVMTAEVRDLQPATTYCCRAFVRTAAGTTYGEEQTFTTQEDPTGIGYINTGAAEVPTVTGYYDLSGRLSSTPHHGVNIVRYSDGTTRKVIMK